MLRHAPAAVDRVKAGKPSVTLTRNRLGELRGEGRKSAFTPTKGETR
jgi:hypothetical protein